MTRNTGTPQSIAARIKMARKMAGFATQAQLLQEIEDWKPSRLGNYEAAVSTPGPDDIRKISEATQVSPCWIMFGDGPIRPSARDLQAIRHQNLSHEVEVRGEKRGAVARLAKAVGLPKEQLEGHVENPFQPITDSLARRFEKALDVRDGWMDEQHVEHDPLCQSFPEDIRELMLLYSGLDPDQRRIALSTLRGMSEAMTAK